MADADPRNAAATVVAAAAAAATAIATAASRRDHHNPEAYRDLPTAGSTGGAVCARARTGRRDGLQIRAASARGAASCRCAG